ncbi:hypothetical protein JNUCC64_10045 [Streptomyces sp. JNUCC 64]
MTTLLDYLVVTFVLALLVGPALPGHLRELRIDRELRAARDGRPEPETERSGTPLGVPDRSPGLAA